MATTPPARHAPASTASPSTPFDERYLNAKLDAVEARTETKFAQLLGKLDVISEKLGGVAGDVSELKGSLSTLDSKTNNTRVIIITTAIGTVIGIVGLLYALIGYGNMVADSVTAAYGTGVSVGQSDNPSRGDQTGQN